MPSTCTAPVERSLTADHLHAGTGLSTGWGQGTYEQDRYKKNEGHVGNTLSNQNQVKSFAFSLSVTVHPVISFVFVPALFLYFRSTSLPLFSFFKGSIRWGLQPMDLFTYIGGLPTYDLCMDSDLDLWSDLASTRSD